MVTKPATSRVGAQAYMLILSRRAVRSITANRAGLKVIAIRELPLGYPVHGIGHSVIVVRLLHAIGASAIGISITVAAVAAPADKVTSSAVMRNGDIEFANAGDV
jgi:hypothetical protein